MPNEGLNRGDMAKKVAAVRRRPGENTSRRGPKPDGDNEFAVVVGPDGDGEGREEDEEPEEGLGEPEEGPGEAESMADLDYEERQEMFGVRPEARDPESEARAGQDEPEGHRRMDSANPVKRGRGRPPKPRPDEILAGDRQANAGMRTPEPPHHMYKTGNPVGRRPSDAIRWVCRQPDWVKDRLIVYVYRRWPVIDLQAASDPVPGGQDPKYIEKRSGMDMFDSVDSLMKVWGSGDYTIRVNDTVTKKGTIAVIVLDGLRNPDYPPIIEDLRTLVMDDPANKTYIAQLRARGIPLPGDEPQPTGPTPEEIQREQEEMATSQILDRVTEQNERLVEKLVDISQRKGKADEEARPRHMDSEGEAVRLISETARQTIDMVRQNIGNPAQQVDMILAAAERMRPAPGPDPMATITPLLQQMMERDRERDAQMAQLRDSMTMQQIEMMREQLKAFTVHTGRGAVDPATGNIIPTVNPAGPTSSLRQQIEEYRDLKALFAGEDEEDSGSKKSAGGGWTDHLPMILQGLTMLGGIVATSLHNMAVARTGQGQPMNPQTAPGPQPGTPNPSPAAPAGSTEDPMLQYYRFLDQIQEPLVAHLNNPDKDGVDFAEWLIGSRTDGYSFYCQLRDQAGTDNIMALFRSYPPIWSKVGNNEPRLLAFIQEFMERDQRLAAEAAGEEMEEPEPAPAPAPAPAIRKRPVAK